MRYFLVACLTAMVGLCILDSYSTYIILQDGGREINPIMNWLISKMGVGNALVFPKLVCLLILCHGTFKALKIPLSTNKMRLIACTYVILIGIYSVVVFQLNMPYLNAISGLSMQ